MRKRVFGVLCAALVMILSIVPVSAAAENSAPDDSGTEISISDARESEVSTSVNGAKDQSEVGVSVSEGVIGYAKPTPSEVKHREDEPATTLASIGLYPFEIRYDTHNGAPIVIKSFRVPAGFDPVMLVESEFEDTGYMYSKKDILKNDPEVKTEQKLVAQTVTFNTENNEQGTMMSFLSPIVEYAEGGFTGQLELDMTSIQSIAAGVESYSYPIRRTVEYNGLDRNDYSYLDKELGSLTLQEAEWTAKGTTQRGDTMVPSSYDATAVYTGIGYGTKVTGYNNSAVYKGYVTRAIDGESIYSVIYQGIKIMPDTIVPWGFVGVGFLVLLIGVGGTYLAISRVIPAFKSRKGKTSAGADVPVDF